ncbi:MAG: hypothetical protein IKC24_04230 [Oscillospiraceae bacterium]|nr:hypothetical protein [Oscillospiraceae bacterium]
MDNTKLKFRLGDKVQTLQETQEMGVVAATAKLSLAPVDSSYIALNHNALDIIRENLKSQPMTYDLFDVVKSPSGGSTVFSVPGLAGDEAEKELVGIILDYTTPRAYWTSADPVEGTPPDCMSADSIVSHDGKPCAMCPFNDFGSKDGDSNAKACKESVLLLLLRPNSIMPLLVRVPVTSKPRFLKYMARLVGMLTPISGVVTKIALEKATSKGGKPYALFNFNAVNVLSPEETALAREFSRRFTEMVNLDAIAPEMAEAN